MSDAAPKPGDEINGYRLSEHNVWYPLPDEPPVVGRERLTSRSTWRDRLVLLAIVAVVIGFAVANALL
jgi:hypothetical protein